MTFLGCVSTTQSQPKEPQINLLNKFNGTCSKFQSFVKQICLVIWLHPYQYPIGLAQVGLVDILLLNTTLVWFAPLLEHQSPLLNDFETFLKKFNVTFRNSDKECTSNIKIWSFCQGSHSTIVYASKLNSWIAIFHGMKQHS